ncbi:hypothetical protein HQ403_02590 [Candidatus Kaiserbacteria bacterium]|nr:hypothetical protein [Candidatus Kaiserbacteria bacterium]
MKTTPKDFFFSVGAFAALYISAVSLLTLLFQYIDILFKDALDTFYDPYSGAIRFSIASLIIIFPLYVYLTRLINQDIRMNPEKKEVGVRKWLIYLTLFVAGATIIIDLIVLINTFLGGEELTSGFILKVISVLVVIGGVFLYYLYDLRGKWETSKSLSQTIGGIVSILILSAIVGGFFIIGSPQTQRLIRFDQDKINDLSSIQWQIVNFYQQKERFPKSLDELEDPLVGFIVPKDSQTGNDYIYNLGEGTLFELCANFNKESRGYAMGESRIVKPINSEYGYGLENENWTHGEGEACFERTIDPDKFPPLKR